jgi:hypothetical protein
MRRPSNFFFAIVFFSSFANAAFSFWPVLLKARGERNEGQSLELKSNYWPSMGVSYTFDNWLLSLDSSRYIGDESKSGNVSIQTKYEDTLISGGYSLFQGELWDFYAVATAGMYRQKVKTTISGLSSTSTSGQKALVGMGTEYLFKSPFNLSFAAGARLNWTEDLEPEIMPEIYLKLGIGF